MNYLQIPCSCSDCMQNPEKGLIFKAKFKVGDLVETLVSVERDLGVKTGTVLEIKNVFEEEGQMIYRTEDFFLLDDEIVLVKNNKAC